MVGAHVVIAEKFSATQFWMQVTDYGATFAHTIFTLPPILKAQPPSQWDRAHKLRAMYNANSDPEFEKRFNVRLVEAYGGRHLVYFGNYVPHDDGLFRETPETTLERYTPAIRRLNPKFDPTGAAEATALLASR